MAGTGLPDEKSRPVLAEAPPIIDGDRYSSAAAWGKMAAAAESISKDVANVAGREVLQQQAKATADFEVENTDWFIKARDQYNHDPQGFENAARAHTEGVMGQVPDWMLGHAKRFMNGKLETNLSTVLSETRTRNTALAAQSVDARRQSADNEVLALAGAGKVGTPEWEAANRTYDGVIDTAVSTGLMSNDKATLLRDDLAGRAHGEIAARAGVDVYRKEGMDAATQYLKSTILDNDKLSLKTAERYKAFNRGMAAIRLEAQVDKEDRGVAITAAQDLRARIDSNQPYDKAEVEDTLAVLRRSGAAAEYKRLSVAHATAEATQPFRSGLNLKEFDKFLRERAPTARIEGLSPNFTEPFARALADAEAATGSKATVVSLHRTGEEQAKAYSKFINTGKGLAAPPGHSRHEIGEAADIAPGPVLDWLHENAGKYGLEFLKGDAFKRDPVHIQLSRNGTRPTPALVTVDGAPIDQPTTSPNGVPYMGEVTKRVQQVFVQQAKAAWPDFKAKIDQGRVLDNEDFNAVRYAAALSGDSKWIDEVETKALANRIGGKLDPLPVAQHQAAIDEARANLSDDVTKSLEAQFARQQTMLKEDPVGYAIERGRAAPRPIDAANPDQFRAGLAERAVIVRGVADSQGIPVGSVLRKTELESVQAILQKSDAKGKARVFADLATLPEDARNATFAALGMKGKDALGDAFAGALYARAPDVAESILRGRTAMAADERLDPSKGKNRDTFNSEFDKALPSTTFGLASRTSENGAYTTIKSAVRARYADLAAQAGDTEGKFKDERLTRAVNDVTGGVLKHNGGTLIAPLRGMTQAQFDAVLWGVKDSDLQGVTTLSGQAVTADYLRGSARLQSVGDGRYLVLLGKDPERPIYAFQNAGEIHAPAPIPFEIDLRDRKPGVRQRVDGVYGAGYPRG